MSSLGLGGKLLVAAIVLVVLLHFAVIPDRSQRSFQILADMHDSVPYDSQGSTPVTGDGSGLLPPPGSAAVGYPAFRYSPTPEEALRAGEELRNPESAEDARAVERGAFVYRTFCEMCHAANGSGQGPMTKRGVPPPPSLLAERAREMKDGQMYHVLTLGQGNMASYASQVERSDRWKVILYVRSLQQAAPEDSSR